MSRSLHLDLIRLIACIMIVMMHAPMPNSGCPGWILVVISYMTAPAIGLFFMVSGALLLRKYDLNEFRTDIFLKKRLTKVLFPTVFWYICGTLLSRLGVHNDELGILWFMYSLIGLYLLAPILIRWISVASRREMEFYLFLWIISLCYPLLNLYFDFRENVASWVYYFHGYVGYFVLGSYLTIYGLTKRMRYCLSAAFAVFSIALPACSYILQWNWPMIPVFWYRSISVALMSVVWWEFLRHLSHRLEFVRNLITTMSELTFGIYLIHILIMRSMLWHFSWMLSLSGIVQILFCAVLTFLLSSATCWMLSKRKYSKYIIGI